MSPAEPIHRHTGQLIGDPKGEQQTQTAIRSPRGGGGRDLTAHQRSIAAYLAVKGLSAPVEAREAFR